MAGIESTPASLAQLIRRRATARVAQSVEPVPDRLGQFGLLFTEAQTEEPQGTPAPQPAVEIQRKLWSVAELVGTLRGKLERDYADMWVQGEISNCKPAASGHLYFTLKDGDAQLLVVLFRRQVALLRFRPEDGLSVLVRGRVSVFESRGQLQLIAESLEPRGAGALQLAFEQLKAKLRAEGLFNTERKRPLPTFPRTIGVITSIQGAVLRDIVTVCRRRHGCLNILVYPAAVQGTACAGDVLSGVRYLNAMHSHRVDVIVIARGGGSAENLAGFNDETLARAIAASELPVVSAVGHETDFTIADFVSDVRAPTPSAAAELITAAQHRIEERVQALEARLLRGIGFGQMHARQRFTRVTATAAFARMRDSIARREQRVDSARFRLEAGAHSLLQARTEWIRGLAERLQWQHVQHRVLLAHTRNERLRERLLRAGTGLLHVPRQRMAGAEARLHTLSPTAVLRRGYALAFRADGTLLRSPTQVGPGDSIITRLAAGEIRSRVTETAAQPKKETDTA